MNDATNNRPSCADTDLVSADKSRNKLFPRPLGVTIRSHQPPTPADLEFTRKVYATINFNGLEENERGIAAGIPGFPHKAESTFTPQLIESAADNIICHLQSRLSAPWLELKHGHIRPREEEQPEQYLPEWLKEKLALNTRARQLLLAQQALDDETAIAKKNVQTAERMLDLYYASLGVSNPPTEEQLNTLTEAEKAHIETLKQDLNVAGDELALLTFMSRMVSRQLRKITAYAKELCDKHAPKEEDKKDDDPEREEDF